MGTHFFVSSVLDDIADGSIVNADVADGAAINAAKIANGTVSSAQFQYLGGATSNIQTQLNTMQLASTALKVLSTTSGIDGTAAAATTLYTPSGVNAFVVGVIVRVTAATNLTVAGAGSVGTNATNYNNILPITTYTGVTAVNTGFGDLNDETLGGAPVVASGTAIKIKITTPFTATACTLAVDLLGYTF